MNTATAKGSIGVAMLRIALGITIVVTWFDNLDKDLYTADGFRGFLNSLDAPDGNDSSLGWFHSLLDTIVISNAGFFAPLQLVVELAIGVCLVLGLCTRAASLAAFGFFFSLFLAYFGGHEWIWTYVVLSIGALAVFLDWGGRRFGADEAIAARHGASPGGLVW